MKTIHEYYKKKYKINVPCYISNFSRKLPPSESKHTIRSHQARDKRYDSLF